MYTDGKAAIMQDDLLMQTNPLSFLPLRADEYRKSSRSSLFPTVLSSSVCSGASWVFLKTELFRSSQSIRLELNVLQLHVYSLPSTMATLSKRYVFPSVLIANDKWHKSTVSDFFTSCAAKVSIIVTDIAFHDNEEQCPTWLPCHSFSPVTLLSFQ